MIRRIQLLDPLLAIGLVISIALALILVLIGQDEVQSLLVGLTVTAITLLLDIVARLRETERRSLDGSALGNILINDQDLHAELHQIAKSYQAAQQKDFDLFIERSRDVLLDCKEILGALERGYTMVEAGGKYSYGRRGVKRAQRIVKAVAYEDVESWRTVHLQDVIRVNADAVKRGILIQRVFILKQESVSNATDVLEAHKDAGVQVYIVSPNELPTTQLMESFQIVDDEILVIFYYTRDGSSFREEKVSIDPIEVDRAIGRFDSILRRAKPYSTGSTTV